jgi:hypothetical protein
MEAEPGGRSATEIAALWDYLHERLRRGEGVHPNLSDDKDLEATNLNSLGRRVPSFGRRALQ